MEPVIEKLCSIASIDELGHYYDAMDDDELINILTNAEDLEYKNDELKFHTISYFVSAYFSENPTPKYTISANDKGRYATFFGEKERGELQKNFLHHIYFLEQFL